MNETITVITLGIICVLQLVERYLYQKDMTNKLNDAIKAVMSRNIGEYIMATTQPKNNTGFVEEPDQVDLSPDNPELFDKAIKKM